MVIANNADDYFLIKSRKKVDEDEIDEMWTWVDDHNMTVRYTGNGLYEVIGGDDALMFKLKWG